MSTEDKTVNTDKTGGTRYSAGKPGRFWCAPLYGLRLVSQVWTAGGDKYAPLDWQEGQSFASLFDCMSRHWLEIIQRGVWARDDSAGGTGALHLANLVWNALCLLTFMALGRDDLDDMSGWRGMTAAQASVWRAEHGDDAPPSFRGDPMARPAKKVDPGASSKAGPTADPTKGSGVYSYRVAPIPPTPPLVDDPAESLGPRPPTRLW